VNLWKVVPAGALDKPKRARLLLLIVEWVRALLDVNIAWVGFVERRHGPLGLGGDGGDGGDGAGFGLGTGFGGGLAGGLGGSGSNSTSNSNSHGGGGTHKGAGEARPTDPSAPGAGAPLPPPPAQEREREQRPAWAVAGTERGPLAPIDRILTSSGLAGAPLLSRYPSCSTHATAHSAARRRTVWL